MLTNLIALKRIPAGAVSVGSLQIESGEPFVAEPDVAEKLLTSGEAKLADALIAGDPKAPEGKPAPKPGAKLVKARLLVDSALGNCNDVVELDAATIKDAEAAGLADSHKASVAYAQGLPQNRPEPSTL